MICLCVTCPWCHFKSREPNLKTQSPTRISRNASWKRAGAPPAGWKGSFASYLMTRRCSQIRSPFVAYNILAPSTRTQRDSNQNTIWEGSPADAKPLLQGVWEAGAPLSCLCHLCASPLRPAALWGLLVFFSFLLLWECGPGWNACFQFSLYKSDMVEGSAEVASASTVQIQCSYIYKYIWQDGEIKQHQAEDGWRD